MIVDPTADQWHLPDFPDVAVIAPSDPRYSRYVTGTLFLDDDGYMDMDDPWIAPQGFSPVQPPAPELRGIHRGANQGRDTVAA